MTIDEAIKILSGVIRPTGSIPHDKYDSAIKLGKEALERLKDMRISPCTTSDEILPGETKD